MTISNTSVKAQFAGNLLATAFPFTFKTYAAADVQVTLTDTAGADSVLTLNADYTVALNADQNASPGGTVTYLLYKGTGLPLPVGAKLTLLSNASDLQGTALVNGGAFFAVNVTDMADLRTIISHQKQEALDRSLKFPASDAALTVTLPNAASRASKYLAFDAGGSVIAAAGTPGTVVVSVFMATVLDDVDAAAALTTLGFSAFIKTLIDDVSAAAARATLAAVGLTGDENVAGVKTFTGTVRRTGQPAFFAYLTADDVNVTGNATTRSLQACTVVYDQASNFNVGTGIFTAPVSGVYDLNWHVTVGDLSAAALLITVQLATSNQNFNAQSGLNPKAGALQTSHEVNVPAYMDAGDTAQCRVQVTGMAGDTADILGGVAAFTFFAGSLKF